MGTADTEKPRSRKSRIKKLPSLVKWLRSSGAGAVLLGLGGLAFADWFWVGVAALYLGFGLFALDVWFEPEFRDKWKQKLIIWGVILLLVTAFSWSVVFAEAPLPVSATVTDGEYPIGTVIAGIIWKPQFTELNVDVENPEDRPYEELNLVVRPTSAVAAIAQTSSVSDVSFEDKNGASTHLLDLDPGTGISKAVPLLLVATDAGYRVRCGRLPGHAHLKLVMALADLMWPPHSTVPPEAPIEQKVRDPNYLLRMTYDDFSTYWLGYRDGDVYAHRPTSSEWLKIEGDYTYLHRRRTISQRIMVGGKISIKRRQDRGPA